VTLRASAVFASIVVKPISSRPWKAGSPGGKAPAAASCSSAAVRLRPTGIAQKRPSRCQPSARGGRTRACAAARSSSSSGSEAAGATASARACAAPRFHAPDRAAAAP
jgi:hypothetical protein